MISKVQIEFKNTSESNDGKASSFLLTLTSSEESVLAAIEKEPLQPMSLSSVQSLYQTLILLHHPTCFTITSYNKSWEVICQTGYLYEDFVKQMEQEADDYEQVNGGAQDNVSTGYECVLEETLYKMINRLYHFFYKDIKERQKVAVYEALVKENPNCPVLLVPLTRGTTIQLKKCGHILSRAAWHKTHPKRCPLCRVDHSEGDYEGFGSDD